jgi:hypothetical protein
VPPDDPARALAPAAARALGGAGELADPQAAGDALETVADAVGEAHAAFGRLALAAPAWLASPALAPALRPALDALFMATTAAVRGLAGVAGALDFGGGPLAAALDACACAAFARPTPPPPAAADVLGALYGAMAAEGRRGATGGTHHRPSAAAALLARLPSAAALAPAWAEDAVAASRAQVALLALAQGAAALPPAAARDGALPLACLYAAHPAPPLAAAAVTAAGALLAAGAPVAVGQWGPAFLDRVLSPSSPPPPPALAPALAAAVGACPPLDPGAALIVRRLARALGEAAAREGGAAWVDPLAAALAASLLASDAASFAAGAAATEAALAAAPRSPGRARAVAGLGAGVAAANDAVRKPAAGRGWEGVAARLG